MQASTPHNEQERLQALNACKLLDTPPEEAYDRITHITSQLFSAPIAAISLVAKDRQFFKSIQGLSIHETGRDVSFCAHAILQDEPTVVLDALQDERFHDNLLVTGEPGIRFYCGAPLKTTEGFAIGALCVIDTEPRIAVPEPLVQLLRELAAQVGREIEHQQKLEREKQLRQDSEIQAELALEAGNMGCWQWDAESRRTVFSPVMQHLWGYSGAETAHSDFEWLENVHPEDRNSLMAVIKNARREQEVFTISFRVVLPDHGLRWLVAKGRYRRDGNGVLAGARGVCWDITDRKKAEQELQAREEVFRGISASSPVGIFQADLNGSVCYANPRFCEIWSSTEAEILGTGWLTRLHPEDAPLLATGLIKANKEDKPFEMEHRLLLPDGSVRWVHGRSSILCDGAGHSIGTVGTVDDITERKRLEDERHASQEQLCRASAEQKRARELAEEANRAKSFFLANVSHELRTPLNGVLGITELLLQSGLQQEQQELAQTVKQSGTALLALVNDLLDLGRVEAGKLDCKRAVFDLKIVINQAVALIAPEAALKGLNVTITFPDSWSGLLIGDENRIRQVLVNYLTNALKFTEKGQISVEVRAESCRNGIADIQIAVSDTGKGIAQEFQVDLFTPFRQIDSSNTRKQGGLGLGLALSKRIAETMGGSVGLTSELGKGSTFWIRLSLALANQCNSQEQLQSLAVAWGEVPPETARVLVAEDNVINQKIVLQFLKKLGCRPDLAPDGAAALRLFHQNRYDLVLMDCQMPEMDGYEATMRIRELEHCRHLKRTPIVALTAHAMVGDRERCLQSGMDDHITKPRRMEVLQAVLAKWMHPVNAAREVA